MNQYCNKNNVKVCNSRNSFVKNIRKACYNIFKVKESSKSYLRSYFLLIKQINLNHHEIS